MTENCEIFCRTCLSFIKSSNAVSVNQYADKLSSHHIQIREVIEQCVSEMDLDVSNDAVLCNPCYDALICTYTFKLKCIQTEERIYSYIEENDLRLGDKIELSKVVKSGNFEVQDTIIISDSESIEEVINLSEYENEDVLSTPMNRLDNFANNGVDFIEIEHHLAKESSSTSTVCMSEHYTCAKCLYKTYRKDMLVRHVHFNCSRRNYKYRCHICLYESARKNHISRHMAIHGGNSRKRRYHCGLCNKHFTVKGKMRLHILYKHSGSMSPYKCGIGSCKYIFEKKIDYNNHIVTHVSYKPFVCQLCRKGFFSEKQWDAHLEHIHGLSL